MKKVLLAASAAVLVGVAVQAALAGQQPVRAGVGPAAGKVVGSAVVPGTPGSVVNFDDVNAPCNFADTVALRRYHGVSFKGSPKTLDGGAILNECSNFAVTGYSPPNFLAFNCNASLSNGGIPRLPESINLGTESSNVSLALGSGLDSATVKILGKGSQGKQTRRVVLASQLTTVTFTIPVKTLKLTSPNGACAFVLDNLSF
jgi:hypothetical protein